MNSIQKATIAALKRATKRLIGRLREASRALLFAACCLILVPPSIRAQSGIGDVVYTVGTVAQDSHGQNWAYLLWQGTQPGLVSNRVFAVYSKPGDPTNNVSYVRLSLVSLQTDARVIEPLLRRAEEFGDDPVKFQQDLQQLFASLMPTNAISRADQLSAVMRGSLGDPRNYANLLLLARNHPGIDLALGFADAELIGPGKTTFEVRAFDPITSKDLAVVGRVTVQSGNPTVLPAPGPPVLIPDPSPRGDINLRFRWGTPDNLRRLGLMQSGFNLYRVAEAYAVSQGWNEFNPPPVLTLSNLVANSPAIAKRVNTVPITPSTQFTIPDAANIIPPTGDTNTSFIMDDDHRGRSNYVNLGFTNGALFYYYVTARDVLGRDGLISTGLLATVCDRMPPLPPFGIHVVNDYTFDTNTMTSNQALRVIWKQNPNTNDLVTNYWVYRWTSVTQMNALQTGISNNLIAVVPQIPGATNNSFLDNGAGSPSSSNLYGITFWYTIRAGDAGACGQNLSGPGGPAYGVLRQRNGPGPGSGYLTIDCLQPTVNFLGYTFGSGGTDNTNFDLLVSCSRSDARFVWSEMYGIITYSPVTGGGPITVSNFLGRFYYSGGTTVSTLWRPPRAPTTNNQYTVTINVGCRAALNNGKVSADAVGVVAPPDTKSVATVRFQAIAQDIQTVAGGANGGCTQHDPNGGGIIVNVFPSPGTAEYRIYRRVDNGPMSLLCQGAVTNIASIIQCIEAGLPVSGGTVCFYYQLLDANGNPSGLYPLGCVDTLPKTDAVPTPVLAKITALGSDPTSAGMTLSWFCPPYGVERFEVDVAGLLNLPNTNGFQFSSVLAATGATSPMIVTNAGTNLNLTAGVFITPRVGPGFGNNGAQFTAQCNVTVGETYFVTVRALGKGSTPGDFSNLEQFFWAPTNPVLPQVPWPARGLPSTNANFSASAYFLSPGNPNPLLASGTNTGNAVFIGSLLFPALNNIDLTSGHPAVCSTSTDPNTGLLTNTNGDSLFPVAMYRWQVANANFPVTSGDVIQVSPLMENIAYQISPTNSSPLGGRCANSTNTLIIWDPFVTGTVSPAGASNSLNLWLLDTQPQISGARYQYMLVRFKGGLNGNHEIDQVIPSTQVDVP